MRDSLAVVLTLSILFLYDTCKGGSTEPWVMVREMSPLGYQMKSVEKISDSENQTYIIRIKAPLSTAIKKLAWHGTAEIRQVSEVDGGSVLYEARVSTGLNTYMPSVLLTSVTEESLSLDFNIIPLRDSKQVNFKINDCQLRVERRDKTRSTTYRFTVRGCASLRRFKGSVGKETASGIVETVGLFPEYFSASHKYIYGGSNEDDQVSTTVINRAALNTDNVHILSLRFLIETQEKDSDSDLDFVVFSTYTFSVT